MQFYQIKINHNNEEIILNPIKCLRILDDSHRIVVIYEITYITKDLIKDTSYVSYYLSDGNSNHLRANMLYPLMCYHQKDDSSCIKISGQYEKNYKLLVKIGGINNISLDIINKNILNKVKNQIHIEKKKKLEEADSLLISYFKLFRTNIFLDFLSSDQTKFNHQVESPIGLISIVSRIENLLDLIIALYSEHLINIKSIEHYKPIPLKEYERLKTLGIDVYDFTNTFSSLGFTEILSEDNLYIDTILRKNLINELHNIIKLFIKTNLLNVSSVVLEPEIITKFTFNNEYAEICKENEISKIKIINYKKYFEFSQKILEIISNKISYTISNFDAEITKINQEKSMSLKKRVDIILYKNKIKKLNDFKLMLLRETLYANSKLVDTTDYLSRTISAWSGSCKH